MRATVGVACTLPRAKDRDCYLVVPLSKDLHVVAPDDLDLSAGDRVKVEFIDGDIVITPVATVLEG